MNTHTSAPEHRVRWNKGKLIGQKAPLRISEIWAIRVRLEIYGRRRDLALFNLAIDSKLRGCDLVQLRVQDICHGNHVASRATVIQQKTKHPVQFELTAGKRKSLVEWISSAGLRHSDYLFPSRIGDSPHISTRPTLIYRRAKNLRAVQLLLGHTRLESTVRYLGIEVDDALEMAEQTDA